MSAIIKSIGGLSQVGMLLIFVFTLYGIVGMQLFAGNLRQRCFWTAGSNHTGVVLERETLCSLEATGTSSRACAVDQSCEVSDIYPANGVIGFDNIAQALLTLLQCATMEGWTDVMYLLWESNGIVIPTLYFFTMVLLLSWFMIELVTGVVYEAYCKSAPKDQGERRRSRWKKMTKTVGAFLRFNTKVLPEGAVDDPKDPGYDALKPLANSSLLNTVIMIFIGINTLLMAAEHVSQVINTHHMSYACMCVYT